MQITMLLERMATRICAMRRRAGYRPKQPSERSHNSDRIRDKAVVQNHNILDTPGADGFRHENMTEFDAERIAQYGHSLPRMQNALEANSNG